MTPVFWKDGGAVSEERLPGGEGEEACPGATRGNGLTPPLPGPGAGVRHPAGEEGVRGPVCSGGAFRRRAVLELQAVREVRRAGACSDPGLSQPEARDPSPSWPAGHAGWEFRRAPPEDDWSPHLASAFKDASRLCHQL